MSDYTPDGRRYSRRRHLLHPTDERTCLQLLVTAVKQETISWCPCNQCRFYRTRYVTEMNGGYLVLRLKKAETRLQELAAK